MKAGDSVRIFPTGQPDQSADATVIICDDLGLALAFDRMPPFKVQGLTYPSRHHDITIILIRTINNGVPGPWLDRRHQLTFTIEEL